MACEKSAYVNNNGITHHNCSPPNIDPCICFDSLITDSRCPKEVNSEGHTAIIKITFYEGGNMHRFRMSLKGFPSMGCQGDTIINEHKIVFTKLTSYPESIISPPTLKNLIAYFEIIR